MPYRRGMPYTLIFTANEVGNFKNVCHMREYAYIEVCLMRGLTVRVFRANSRFRPNTNLHSETVTLTNHMPPFFTARSCQ